MFVNYKVMQNFYFIGIDVSKKKLDICVMSNSKVLKEEQVSNHPQAIATVIAGIKEELSMSNDSFIICAEHTGQYTYPLMCACKSVGCKLWLENPSQIKYCSGVTRGKNDNAVRAFVLSDLARAVLEQQRAVTGAGESVFCLKSEAYYYKRWQVYCRVNEIPPVSAYEMRHTFVSIVKQLPAEYIKPIVGHSKSMDTFGVYGHTLAGEQERTANEIGRIFDNLLD